MGLLKPAKQSRRGFTLIEMMIVVTIIAVLASIVIPKFADLMRKAKEGVTKAGLGAMRSALSIYVGDNEGVYPSFSLCPGSNSNDPACLVPKYMDKYPAPNEPPYHADPFSLPTVDYIDSFSTLSPMTPSIVMANITAGWQDQGQWVFFQTWIAGLPILNNGDVLINCTDTDTKGTVWNTY
jgi:general secretion pathway protein G